MFIYAHLILLLAVIYFFISYTLLLRYTKSDLHRANARLYFVSGLFLIFISLIALANNAEQAWKYNRFLAVGHFLIPFISDSLVYISDNKIKNYKKRLRYLIFTPFVLMYFLDIFFPQLTFNQPELTKWGWVYVNKTGNIIFIIYNIIYLLYGILVFVYAVSILYKTKNRIKRKFLIFFIFTFITPVFVFVIMTHLYENGTNFNIPFCFYGSFGSALFVLIFVNRYNVFDITPEYVIRDIISNVTNMIILLNDKEKIVLCNEISFTTLKINKEDLINSNFNKLLPERVSLKKLLNLTKEKKGYSTFIINGKGLEIPVLVTASEVMASKQLIGYLILINDLSNIQQLTDEKRLYELEINALQSQMNPHFIFNSLNAVGALLNGNEKDLTSRYFVRLSSLFRQILEHTGKRKVTVEEEILMLNNYLEIEALRMGKNFQFDIEVKGSDDAYFFEIPPMIVQPLVENALWHGLSKVEGDKKLKIVFYENNTTFKISVIDNGIGINRVNTLTYNEKHNGRSIININERLVLLNKYNEDFEVSLTITDNSGIKNKIKGTTSEIVFKHRKK